LVSVVQRACPFFRTLPGGGVAGTILESETVPVGPGETAEFYRVVEIPRAP